MAMTPEQINKHQAKQTDIKQFIQVLTPFCVTPDADEDVKKIANAKLKELISKIEPGIPETVIKTLS